VHRAQKGSNPNIILLRSIIVLIVILIFYLTLHKSTIKTIGRIQNMSIVIHYVKLYNYINVWNQTDSMSCTWIMFNTTRTKPLCNKKNTERYGYSYKQRNKSDTDNKQIVAKWIQTAIIHMWITLTWQM